MKKPVNKTKPFNTKGSLENIVKEPGKFPVWVLTSYVKEYGSNKKERVSAIREGIPYDSIEVLSRRINEPIKTVLSIIGVPQTTYNKKKNEHSLLNPRDSELILSITELIDFGIVVFNKEEEKFQRWLKKPNLSLGGNSPESMFDTITGIQEVMHCLNKLEYGNLS